MASPSLARIKTIVDAFYEEQPDDLESWLDDRCDDPALRHEVESLLAADANGCVSDADWLMGSFSDTAAGPPEIGELPTMAGLGPEVGGRVGPYRLVDEIGVGGMSVVYRGERADGAFEQIVAVKLLRRRLDSNEARQRFRTERQVLASLDHPGIAQLIDGGVTDGGRPYLVMEYVDGTPITDVVASEQLNLDARLDLLEQVVEAIQAAHRQLVVHRDLKPSNVFVTKTNEGDRQVKILDFGIAKLLGDTLPVTQPRTQTGRRPMTLAYAAPEQVRGGDISTQTDVYQLGTLAYEVLTGTRPFDLRDASLAETERIIAEETPAKPSERTAGTSGAEGEAASGVAPHRLRGDLDTIVRKALRKAPDRRYASVEAFAEDLRRYRRGEPIAARPATLAYRAHKFVRRNARAVAVVAAAVALIVGLTAFYVHRISEERNQARQQAQRAEREARKAEAVSGYLTDLLQSTRPGASAGDTVTAAEMLRRGRRRIDRLDDQPAVQARMLQLLGNAYRERASYDRAAGLLRRSLALRDSIHNEPHRHVANTLEELAHLQQQQANYERADSLWREALARHRDLFGPRSPKLWEPLDNLGLVAQEMGRRAKADSFYREAYQVEQNAVSPDTTKLTATLQGIASVSDRRRRADSLYRKVLSMYRSFYDGPHPKVAVALYNRAELLSKQGHLTRADSLARRAVAIDRQTMGPRHPEVGIDLFLQGNIRKRKGDLPGAISAYRKALAILRARLSEDHPYIAAVRQRLGVGLTELDRFPEAEPYLKQSLTTFRRRGETAQVQTLRSNLADLYSEWGRPDKTARYREATTDGDAE